MHIREWYHISRSIGLGLCISGTGEKNLRWFLDSVFPVVYPTAKNEQLFSLLLYDLLTKDPNIYPGIGVESFVSELLRRCSMESTRSVLWRLFDPQEIYFARTTTQPWSRPNFTRPRVFQLLIEKTGGVEFLRTPGWHRKTQQSLLSYAMESYVPWLAFVQAINESAFMVSEVIKGDLDLYQCGWTEEGTQRHISPF